MGIITQFGALSLDLMFEVEDFRSFLIKGKEGIIGVCGLRECQRRFPETRRITDENRERLIKESQPFRMRARGIKMGGLG